MSVKLAILKSGEHVISDVKELVADEKLHGYLFQNAYVVDARPPEFLTEEQKENNDKSEQNNLKKIRELFL